MTLPLAGRRVLVTRAAHQASKLSDELRGAGAEPVEVPVLEIGPPQTIEPLDRALRTFSDYHWVIFTSANTVRALMDRAQTLGSNLAAAKDPRIAAVGRATAEAVERAGLRVSLVPEAYVAESLVRAMTGQVRGQRILVARAEVARDVLPDALRASGAAVDVVDAYRNTLPEEAPRLLRSALRVPVDAATFTSSSTVTHLAEAAKRAGMAFPFAGVKAISIGPITSQTLREHGWGPAEEAEPSDISGLIAATIRAFVQP